MRKVLATLLLGTTVLTPGCKANKSDQGAARMAAPSEEAAGGAALASPSRTTAMDPGGGAAMGSGVAMDIAGEAPPSVAPAAVAQGPSGVQAGEWDDNANYLEYSRWLEEAPSPRLNVADRQFLVVVDSQGKGVPNCKLQVTDANQRSASLVTMASGRALLFPRAFGLSGQTFTAAAECGQAKATTTLDTRHTDQVARLALTTARELPAKRTIDLAFVLDTTGSMAEEIEAVKTTIRAVAAKLGNAQTDVRVGLVDYKDRGDTHVARTYAFSSDLTAFSRSVAGIAASGGGDTPEDMHTGIATALDKLQWRNDAVARLVFVIADAPPHLDYQDGADYADSAKRAASQGIKLFTVSASGMDDVGQLVMRQMAQFTGASNMFVLRGGAGPSSVGGGEPKSSCGGTQENYTSGKLDQLIVNKVNGELKSLDRDPMRIAGRGQDENAKPCNERLVMAN